MDKDELRKLRVEGIGFSMSDVCKSLKIPKSTYQRYEDGTAAIPEKVEQEMLDLVKRIQTYMHERYRPGGVYHQIVNDEFPLGFMSGP